MTTLCLLYNKFAFKDLNIEENALFLTKKVHVLLLKGHFWGVGNFLAGKCPPAPPPGSAAHAHILTAHEQDCCRFQSYANSAIAYEIYIA